MGYCNAQYGAADGFDEVEFLLEENKFRLVFSHFIN